MYTATLQPIQAEYCIQLQPFKSKYMYYPQLQPIKTQYFKQPNKTKYCTQLKQNILHREMSKNIILIYLQNYNIIDQVHFVCPVQS